MSEATTGTARCCAVPPRASTIWSAASTVILPPCQLGATRLGLRRLRHLLGPRVALLLVGFEVGVGHAELLGYQPLIVRDLSGCARFRLVTPMTSELHNHGRLLYELLEAFGILDRVGERPFLVCGCDLPRLHSGFNHRRSRLVFAQVAEVAEAAYKEGMAKHVTLSTGTKLSRGKGLEDLIEAAKLIQKRANVSKTLNFEPLTDYSLLESLLREGKEAGATTALCNIECFDESLREDIMPMKGKNTIEDYMRVWEKCVDIFDHNEVYTMVIAGLGESDESILGGVELAASIGVVTSIVPHTPMKNAVYEDMEPPSVKRMLYLYEAALPIYEKYGLRLYGGTGGIYTSLKGM